MKKIKEENKTIKAWAVIDKKGEIMTLMELLEGARKSMAIFELSTRFNKEMLKVYHAKVVPCEITLLN